MHEQQERMLGHILSEMRENKMISIEGRIWYINTTNYDYL